MPGPSDAPRIYGQADPDNRQPPPEQGVRGEQGAPDLLRTDLTHSLITAEGAKIAVQEQSGAAFAEATGTGDGADCDTPEAPQAS